MITLHLFADTPSWHCGVPTDPSRWRRVVTRAGGVAIEAEYTAPEMPWGVALAYDYDENGDRCYRMPLVAVLRALELGERGVSHCQNALSG